MRKIRENGIASKDAAFLAFGKAMAAWARIERGFYLWFEHITLLDYQKCNPLYYSVQTFRGRMDLLKAALSCNTIEKDELKFIETAMKVVLPYVSIRNQLAHGEFTLDGLVVDSRVVGREKRLQSVVSLEKLTMFTQEAETLARLMAEARDFALGFESPDEHDASLQKCVKQIQEIFEVQKNQNRTRSQRNNPN